MITHQKWTRNWNQKYNQVSDYNFKSNYASYENKFCQTSITINRFELCNESYTACNKWSSIFYPIVIDLSKARVECETLIGVYKKFDVTTSDKLSLRYLTWHVFKSTYFVSTRAILPIINNLFAIFGIDYSIERKWVFCIGNFYDNIKFDKWQDVIYCDFVFRCKLFKSVSTSG